MTEAPPERRLTVMSRDGCHLCEVMIQALRTACRDQRVAIEVVDVDRHAELAAAYGPHVPVLLVDGREICHYRLDPDALRRALG